MKSKRTFRDFLYDKNDILIAFLIIVAAMLMIAWRVSKVMDYPNTLDSVKTAEDAQSAAEEEGLTESDNDIQMAEWTDGKLAYDITCVLSDESTDAAIDSLVTQGVFRTAGEFKRVCRAAGVKSGDIKTGSFTFKKGSSKKKIAKQVTQ